MQTTALRYFLTVARTGSIAAASAQLNVAASAISRQIANLEAELDCVLFERRPRGMVPSPAGELLAQHAHQMLLRSEQVVTEIRELEGLARGLIRVACSEGFSLDIVPNAVASFHATHPGLRFEVTVLPPAQVTQIVAAGEADLGITFALAPTPQVETLYDGQVDMRALAAPDHPLARASVVPLSELARYPLALPTRETTLRQVFDAACLHEGIVVEPVLTANYLSTLLPFVRNSRGLAVMSELSVRTPLDLSALISLPIDAQSSLFRGIKIQAMRDRRLPRAVRSFLRQLLDALPPARPPSG